MAFPRRPSSRLSDVQLPIVLIPDDDDDDMDSERNLDLHGRKCEAREEPPPSSAPEHPIPSMQQAFAESLVEATDGHAVPKPKLRTGDAKARREELLDQDKSDPPPTALWRRPGQKSHELWRLMAQITFGVHLLLNGLANSQHLVVSILQRHIDEVDEFLETTLEDVDLATRDMEERIKHLKLPMDNIEVFERMLEDRNFRLQILDGNQKIDHISTRTKVALKQTMHDLTEGIMATREFSIYLAEHQHGSWRQERPDVIDIFDAMKGNTDGWFNAFMDLQARGSALNALIVKLGEMVSEMERRAGEVSRRTRFTLDPYSSPKHGPRASDASSVTTPPSSPPVNIPNSPPRLSLRLSTLNTTDLLIDVERQPEGAQDAPKEEGEDGEAPRSPLIVTSKSPPPESSSGSPPGSSPGSPPRSPPARNPRRLSERPAAPPRGPRSRAVKKGEEETGEEDTYILQPRTYTPQPPSPRPSPRIVDERPHSAAETDASRTRSSASSAKSAAVADKLELPGEPRIERVVSKRQVQKPKVVEIGAKADTKPSSRRSPNSGPKLVSKPDPAQAPEPVSVLEPEPETDLQARRKASVRGRLSLKTEPHGAFQTLSSSSSEQRPSHQVHRGYHAPDSAYGSDMERPPVNSVMSVDSSLADFSPPFAQPNMIPSPRSDRQFFLPVQANPYSPLQQRPHTSGTVAPHHFPAPPRNTPSAMGMSMMSNGSAMTNQMGGGKALKKKRSAFGWLKKAFSLDEEERAIFEQRKREQMTNPYYQRPETPQFVDGKRVRPRPAC